MKMEYQKIINLLDNTPNQPTKLRTKNWVEINDESHRVYNTGSQIKFKTSTMSQVYGTVVMHIYLLVEL